MVLKLKIRFEELLELIKQLPAGQLAKLRAYLANDLVEERSRFDLNEFQQMLLNGPTMTVDNYQQFLAHRNTAL